MLTHPIHISLGSPVSHRRRAWLLWVLLAALLLGGIGWGVSNRSWLLPTPQTIVPGVSINLVPAGGLTSQQATARLQDTLPLPTDTVLAVHFRHPDTAIETTWTTPVNRLGWHYDVSGTVAQAAQFGRTGPWWQQLRERWQAHYQGKSFTIQPIFTETAVKQWVTDIAKKVDVMGHQPRVILANGSYRIDGGTRGLVVDQAALVQDILLHPTQTEFTAPITITATPLSPDGWTRAQDRLAKWWSVIINLQLPSEERPLHLGARNFFPWLTLPDGWDTNLIDQQIAQWATDWERPAQDAQFNWDGHSLKATVFQPERAGRSLDRAALRAALLSALNQDHPATLVDITVPFTSSEPATKLAQLNSYGINELIGVGHSSYAHSIANRAHNVALTARNINMTIIPPGKEFSFNAAVGEVSAATGYRPAYVIKDHRTVLGDGGGVCQVSTTTFRAILNAGLPITAWKPHSYRVSYYEEDSQPGYDATVFAPTDLKFINDTNHHIGVATFVNESDRLMRVEFWGTGDGRTATISNYNIGNQSAPPPTLYQEDPTLPAGTRKQVDWSAPGARTSFLLTVKNADGSTRYQRTFVSNFQPWRAVFLVGTGR